MFMYLNFLKLFVCIVSLSAIVSCKRNSNTIIISAVNIDSIFFNVKLGDGKNTFATTFKMEILTNSIDDTVKIGNHKVSPNFTGNIISLHDYYENNYKFCFKSYKAKKGFLKVRYQY